METTDMIGVGFVVLGIIFYFALGIRLYLSYRKTERKQTLYLALLLIFGGIALLSLAVEQVILLVNADPLDSQTIDDALSIFQYSEINVFWVGFLFAAIAWLASSLAIISANFFTHSFFPNANKKLLLVPIVLMTAWFVLLLVSPFYFEYSGSDWSPNQDESITFFKWILFLIPLWTVSVLFLYLTVSFRRKQMTAWKRVGWFFISQAILSIGFTIEILNPGTFTQLFADIGLTYELLLNESFWSLSSRFMVMIYAVMMWFAMYRMK